MENLPYKKSQILSDYVALTIGQLGENISLRRGAAYSTSGFSICGYTHPLTQVCVPGCSPVSVGNHGALAVFQCNTKDQTSLEVQRNIIQHIVGE